MVGRPRWVSALAVGAVGAWACSAGESQAPPPATVATAPIEQFVRPTTPPTPAEDLLTPALTASESAASLVELITDVRGKVVTTRYDHRTRVRPDEGYYAWDCSGMAGWMLRRAAPRALGSIGKRRPRAIDFYRAIVRAPIDESQHGWQQLAHVSDARAGDVFAFPRSRLSKSKVSGHVGFFVEQPWPVPNLEGAWAARIVDATRTPHQDDTRGTGDGFGFGTMMFITDADGKTVAYGWHGTDSGGFMPTHVAYGRVTK